MMFWINKTNKKETLKFDKAEMDIAKPIFLFSNKP